MHSDGYSSSLCVCVCPFSLFYFLVLLGIQRHPFHHVVYVLGHPLHHAVHVLGHALCHAVLVLAHPLCHSVLYYLNVLIAHT